MSRYNKIDIEKIKTDSIKDRKSKVKTEQFAQPVRPEGSFHSFWENLPKLLASDELRDLVRRIILAVHTGKPVLLMMGAHVIKTGLSPVIIDLIRIGVIKGIALNGAGAVHDVELTYFGATSEDVSESLTDGEFGMVKETSELINLTIQQDFEDELGFGEVLGLKIVKEKPAYFDYSILGQAYKYHIPVTVHVALGTDIVHQHPSAHGSAIGERSLRDFHIFTELVSQIHNGGIVLHFGSAVILPEVFLKALSVARNVKGKVNNFTTANFDIIRHYRPQTNIVERPTQVKGKGFNFIGHHEIMLPLLAAAIKEELAHC
jgi:deoxyhypusine synthase